MSLAASPALLELLDRLAADLPRPQLVNDGHAWIAPMVWEARRAVPGPWTWLSAEPVEHRTGA